MIKSYSENVLKYLSIGVMQSRTIKIILRPTIYPNFARYMLLFYLMAQLSHHLRVTSNNRAVSNEMYVSHPYVCNVALMQQRSHFVPFIVYEFVFHFDICALLTVPKFTLLTEMKLHFISLVTAFKLYDILFNL